MDFNKDLENYIEEIKKIATHYVVSTEEGPKNVRVVLTAPGTKSAYCFVEIATGDVYKPASWAGPNKKSPVRGNIHDLKSCIPWIGAYSIRSAR